MVLFTKPEAYQKQIVLYLNNKNYQSAYELSKEFVERFREDLSSYILLAKSAFWMKKYGEATVAGRKAFNMTNNKDDLIVCGVILSTAYYMLGDQKNCREVLEALKADGNQDAQRLMLLVALAANDEKAAAKQIEKLYRINRRLAEDFIMKFF